MLGTGEAEQPRLRRTVPLAPPTMVSIAAYPLLCHNHKAPEDAQVGKTGAPEK